MTMEFLFILLIWLNTLFLFYAVYGLSRRLELIDKNIDFKFEGLK